MGFNTVIVVLNDALSTGAQDVALGARIARAANAWSSRVAGANAVGLVAFGENCSSGYGAVISQDHADGYQVTVTHGNTGWRITDAEMDKHLGWSALNQMRACLERNGYRVSKSRHPRMAEDAG